MNLNRWFLSIILILFSVCIHADETENVQAMLKNATGEMRINLLMSIYQKSLDSDDVFYQERCINEVINEARKQKNIKAEANALAMKMTLYYNIDETDSIYEQMPAVLEVIRDAKEWKLLYETWTTLVDTYNFSGKTNTGLKEVKAMFDDAMERDDKYGMGLAYYTMGNVYANMYNNEEAANSYQQSIDILQSLNPSPIQLADAFAYYCDVLEMQGNYQMMDKITEQWKKFNENYFKGWDERNPDVINRWAYYYLAKAQAALGLDRLDEAAEMLKEVQERCPYEESFLNIRRLHYQGELLKKQGKFAEALQCNNQRMNLMEDSSDKTELIRIRKQRAEIFEGLGRYKEAAEMYNEMYIINDSINANDTKRQLTEMNTLFHVDELKMQQAEAQTRYITIISTIVVVSLVIFIFFRLRAAKRLKIAHGKLEEAHGKLEKTHQDLLTAYDQLEETTAAKERIESDLRIARDIQMSMVPHNFPERDDLQLYASMTPAKEVGGDLYGYHLNEEDNMLYFCLGDVSGKGVPASLFMAQATRLFRTLANQKLKPADIATQINDALSGEDNERGMFVTMFIGLVDLKTGHLDFCNAGHNPPVFGHEFIEMIPNAPIGLWPGLPYEGEEIADISGKPFFVYSDGLNEAENRQQEQFTDERLLELMETVPFESPEKTIEMLKEQVETHRDGAEPNDDLTMICLIVKKTTEKSNNS